MPPTLFLILETPFTQLAHALFPKAVANGIITGAFTFCKSFTLRFNVFSCESLLTLGFLFFERRRGVRFDSLLFASYEGDRGVLCRDEKVSSCVSV